MNYYIITSSGLWGFLAGAKLAKEEEKVLFIGGYNILGDCSGSILSGYLYSF